MYEIYYMIPDIMEPHTLWSLKGLQRNHKLDSPKQLNCNKLPQESSLSFNNLYLTRSW